MKHSRINDLPRIEKPREKLIHYGQERLTNDELVAIILRTGNQKESAIMLAKRIIKTFGSELHKTSPKKLSTIHGIGLAKACEIVACFELGRRYLQDKKTTIILSAEDVWNDLKDIRKSKKEHFLVFFLDSRNQEIKREIISIGTLNASLIHPREVFEPAIKNSAATVLFAHNHPSGGLDPSVADIKITTRLMAAGAILGIEVLDHVIVSEKSWLSMKEEGYMSELAIKPN